ncbi:MAG: preprotein translocase subunit SecG [Planctomycetaceae bacterium]|nr:preprotein translocase subunit SecG [Planctomycetaceae bacterium]
MLNVILAGGLQEALNGVRSYLTIAFVALSIILILFVLFRQTDSTGLAAAFGGGGGTGEGAFGAKSQKVADKVIGWLCGLFIILSLLIAVAGSSRGSDIVAAPESDKPASNNE